MNLIQGSLMNLVFKAGLKSDWWHVHGPVILAVELLLFQFLVHKSWIVPFDWRLFGQAPPLPSSLPGLSSNSKEDVTAWMDKYFKEVVDVDNVRNSRQVNYYELDVFS